jgi:hypothetical protein
MIGHTMLDIQIPWNINQLTAESKNQHIRDTPVQKVILKKKVFSWEYILKD